VPNESDQRPRESGATEDGGRSRRPCRLGTCWRLGAEVVHTAPMGLVSAILRRACGAAGCDDHGCQHRGHGRERLEAKMCHAPTCARFTAASSGTTSQARQRRPPDTPEVRRELHTCRRPLPGAGIESLRATSLILSGATGARLAQSLIVLLSTEQRTLREIRLVARIGQ
jgi:hypothetical protein